MDEQGQKLKTSKERVRQIETKALEKLRKSLLDISQQNKEFLFDTLIKHYKIILCSEYLY